MEGRNRWNYEYLKNLREISPLVRTHLKKVYLTLCCALVALAAGSYMHILWNIGGFHTILGAFAYMDWLLSTPPYEGPKKVALLMATAALNGASIGPLIEVAMYFDPSLVVSAFVGCAVAFGCFSAAAMLARRREDLYLRGLLFSFLFTLIWLRVACVIFRGNVCTFEVLIVFLSGVVCIFELYFGLLVFVGYIVPDTQIKIEKAHEGHLDYVFHSLLLFTAFVGVFVRILAIMVIFHTLSISHTHTHTGWSKQ